MSYSPKTAAIVVTYNRKEILHACLKAVARQSFLPSAVILIDNRSTDGTPEALKEAGILPLVPPLESHTIHHVEGGLPLPGGDGHIPLHYYRLPENVGGAGGFNEGIRRSLAGDSEFLWLMDDDTIAEPDALACLHKAAAHLASSVGDPVGFVCSKVFHAGTEIHRMNLPQLQSLFNNTPFNAFDTQGILLVKAASFVSLLLSRAAVHACGLPYRNFFIWSDDIEYTSRIRRMGFLGAYARDSRVQHRTPENYHADIFVDRSENLNKYRWGIRNELVCLREDNFWLFCFAVPFHLTVQNWRLLRRRRSHRLRCIWIQTLATLSSVFFIPRE